MINQDQKNQIIIPILDTTSKVQTIQRDQQQPSLSDQRKRNDKNKFINKLRQLNTESTDILTLQKSMNSSDLLPADKKERNKIAARSSRDRKKLYIKLMQTKIQNLQMELYHANQQIQQLRVQTFNAQMHQSSKKKQLRTKQTHIIKKLEGLVEAEEADDRNNEINICLDSIIYRVGAMGNERKTALNKLYNDLINFSQPALYRYILWSAIHNRHLFANCQNDEKKDQQNWCFEIEELAAECIRGKQSQLINVKEGLSRLNKLFARNIERLVKTKSEIQKKGPLFDNILNEIRDILAPQQVAQLILFVERHQFKRQIRLFEEDEEALEAGPNKKIKIESYVD